MSHIGTFNPIAPVHLANGIVWPQMWLDLPDDATIRDARFVANQYGYELTYVSINDLTDEDPFLKRYEAMTNGQEPFDLSAWTPEAPEGDDWHLLAKLDSEDGPFVVFGRKRDDLGAAAMVKTISC